MTRFASIVQGVEAAAVGTLAMDTLLYRRYHAAGGESSFVAWESSEGVTSWDQAPAPALVAKRLLEAVLRRDVSPRYVRLLNNVMHWAFGLTCGAGYGLFAGSREPTPLYGLPFGTAVWAAGYVVLPQLGVYEQIWRYDRQILEKDLIAHLVFGAATATAYSILTQLRVED